MKICGNLCFYKFAWDKMAKNFQKKVLKEKESFDLNML